MKIKRLITTVAAGAVALGMSACTAHPGVAFIIDGKEYRTAEVETAANELSRITGQPITPAAVFNFISRLETAKQMAEANQIKLSYEQVEASLEKDINNPENRQFANLKWPLSELTVQTFQANALLNQLNGQLGQQAYANQFLKLQKDRKIELNPRFGSLSESGVLVPQSLIGVVDGNIPTGNK